MSDDFIGINKLNIDKFELQDFVETFCDFFTSNSLNVKLEIFSCERVNVL